MNALSYLDRLREKTKNICTIPELQKLQKPQTENLRSLCSSPMAHKKLIFSDGEKAAPTVEASANDPVIVSHRWLIHYSDRDLVEVACWPDATHAEILERYSDAIAAEPLNPAKVEPRTRLCETCAHKTGRGGCGEPVEAGLSDIPGVIRYNPDQGATCLAWAVHIPADLEARILAMAKRWHYSDDDLATVMTAAHLDPAGWWRVVADDEYEAFFLPMEAT